MPPLLLHPPTVVPAGRSSTCQQKPLSYGGFVFWSPGPILLPLHQVQTGREWSPPGTALNLRRWELECGYSDGNWSVDTHGLLRPSLSKSTL